MVGDYGKKTSSVLLSFLLKVRLRTFWSILLSYPKDIFWQTISTYTEKGVNNGHLYSPSNINNPHYNDTGVLFVQLAKTLWIKFMKLILFLFKDCIQC